MEISISHHTMGQVQTVKSDHTLLQRKGSSNFSKGSKDQIQKITCE